MVSLRVASGCLQLAQTRVVPSKSALSVVSSAKVRFPTGNAVHEGAWNSRCTLPIDLRAEIFGAARPRV